MHVHLHRQIDTRVWITCFAYDFYEISATVEEQCVNASFQVGKHPSILFDRKIEHLSINSDHLADICDNYSTIFHTSIHLIILEKSN